MKLSYIEKKETMDFNTLSDVIVHNFNTNLETWMNSQLFNNDFLTAGIFTVLASAGLYFLRNVPGNIYQAIKKRSTINVEINNNNDYFVKIAEELDRNSIKALSRTKVLDGKTLTIGYNVSFTFFNGLFCIVRREKEKSDSYDFKQFLHLTFFFVSHDRIQRAFDQFITSIAKKQENTTNVYALTKNGFNKVKTVDKRPRKSIFLPDATLEKIEKRIDFFLSNREWYVNTGIPYKCAILLYGPPGTGKTTLAKYIASYCDRNIIFTDPNRLRELAQEITRKERYYDEDTPPDKDYVGILEDIDCYGSTNARSDDDDDSVGTRMSEIVGAPNLSDILNSIDGINSPENFIMVATTNHIDKLDPALIRKGRFDDVIYIGLMEKPEILKMLEVFINKDFADSLGDYEFDPITGAEMQDIILTHLEEPENIIKYMVNEGKARAITHTHIRVV